MIKKGRCNIWNKQVPVFMLLRIFNYLEDEWHTPSHYAYNLASSTKSSVDSFKYCLDALVHMGLAEKRKGRSNEKSTSTGRSIAHCWVYRRKE